MNFETKFNIGQHVWLMKNNAPVEVVISCIEIFYVNTNQDHITYNATDVKNPVTWLDHTKLHEPTLFTSKNELMASLFSLPVCKGENCSAINGVDHSSECARQHEQCHAGS